jgi:thiol-disulfide isomerase/thioredoxin
VALAALAGIQAAAVGIYLAVERDRTGDGAPPFRVERVPGEVEAPDILLEREDGTRLSVRQLGGSVRLIHFWATWCPPCVDELPGLLATSRDLAGRGLTLVAISMDDDWAAIRSFFDGDVPREVYRAVDPDAHERYDIVSLPDTYLVDARDRLLVRYGGARRWADREARDHLSSWLR